MSFGPPIYFEIASAIQQASVQEALDRPQRFSGRIDGTRRGVKTLRFTSFPNIAAARTVLWRPLPVAGLSTLARRRA